MTLGAVLTGVLLAGWGCQMQPAGERAEPGEREVSRLLLTWEEDPTSTMVIQWIEPGRPLPMMAGQSDELLGHELPRVEAASADAAEPGWLDQAFRPRFLTESDHERISPERLDAEAYLAWSEAGLLVLVDVDDPTPVENPELSQTWDGDSIELFIATGVGEGQRYQLVLTSGADPDQDSPRHYFFDRREDASPGELEADYDVELREGGYRVAALLPWRNLGVEPDPGRQIGFQFYVNSREDLEGERRRISWHPGQNTHDSPQHMNTLVLGEAASDSVPAHVSMAQVVEEGIVEVYADAAMAGQVARVSATDVELGSATLQPYGQVARAQVPLPEPPSEAHWGALHVRVDGQWIDSRPTPGTWRYGDSQPASLSYAAHRQDQPQRVRTQTTPIEGWPGMSRQRVSLSGLQPDTAYWFQVEGDDQRYWFYTMPETLSRPIRFATGGDVRHRKEWMLRTNRVAMEHEPEFILWGGDLAYADAREDRIYRWEEWFQANDETLIDEHGFITPVLVTTGNHEVQGGYYHNHDAYEQTDEWRLRIAPYFYQLFAFPGQPGYNVLDFGDYLSIIALDSAHTNPVEGEQTAWLESVLAERQDVPHVFPTYHVAAYPSHRSYGGSIQTRIREQWVPLFEANGIRVAFENHDHTYKRTHPVRAGEIDPEEGIVYIGDGAWGVGTRVGDSRDEWYIDQFASERHAIIVTLEGDRQVYEIYNEDGELIDEYVDPRE